MLASLLALALLAPPALRPNTVVARVGSDAITWGEVASRAQSARLAPATVRDDLVRDALVAAFARRDGLGADAKVKAQIDAERGLLAVAELLREEIEAKIRVTDAELADAFHARHDTVRISMVVRETEEEARGVLERLRAGSGIIEEARSSIDPVGRAKSGVMGTFDRAALEPGLVRAAFAAPLNEPTGPVRVKNGWAVIFIHERSIGDDAAFRRDAPRLVEELSRSRREARLHAFLKTLRARYGVADAAQLLEREARARHLEGRASVAGALRATTRTVLARAYAQRIAQQFPLPREAAIEGRYRDHPDDFWISAHRQCLLLDAPNEEAAQRLKARLVAGEPLEALAREFADPSGPLHPMEPITFADEQLDAIAAQQGEQHVFAWTIRRARTGEWTLTEGRKHWHVVRCDAPQARRRRSLDEARAEIVEQLRREYVRAQLDARIAQVRRSTVVRIERPLPDESTQRRDSTGPGAP